MKLDDVILTAWRQWKGRLARRRLDAPCSIEHEYRGKQWGHPSTYAFVRFECTPANDLVFKMGTTWPVHLEADYCRRLQDAMCAAIVDGLVGTEVPHVGCSLICTEVKWDDVASSEMSFYRATRAAMTALCERKWSLVLNEK
jgi:hypothetical protein